MKALVPSDDLGCPHRSVRCTHTQRRTVAVEAGDLGVLVDAHPQIETCFPEAPRELGRMDHGDAIGVVHGGEVGG